jgi:hypothetical protein
MKFTKLFAPSVLKEMNQRQERQAVALERNELQAERRGFQLGKARVRSLGMRRGVS